MAKGSTVRSPDAELGFAVTTSIVDEVAIIEMGGPRGHALSAGAFVELELALRLATESSAKGVVLTARGRAFSVGADLSAGPTALSDLIAEDGGHDSDWLEPAGRVTSVMRASPIPVVAAINGDAVGGGATLTLGADVRIAASGARFGFGFGRLGVVPEGGSTWLLPRLIGMARAIDWMVSGRIVAAEEAFQAGLVAEVLDSPDLLLARAVSIARAIGIGTSPRARQEVLKLLWDGGTRSFDESRAAESQAMRELASSPDAAEGMAAFLDNRVASFSALGAS